MIASINTHRALVYIPEIHFVLGVCVCVRTIHLTMKLTDLIARHEDICISIYESGIAPTDSALHWLKSNVSSMFKREMATFSCMLVRMPSVRCRRKTFHCVRPSILHRIRLRQPWPPPLDRPEVNNDDDFSKERATQKIEGLWLCFVCSEVPTSSEVTPSSFFAVNFNLPRGHLNDYCDPPLKAYLIDLKKIIHISVLHSIYLYITCKHLW